MSSTEVIYIAAFALLIGAAIHFLSPRPKAKPLRDLPFEPARYTVQATPNLLDLTVDFVEMRRREEDRAFVQRQLDKQHGIAPVGSESGPKS